VIGAAATPPASHLHPALRSPISRRSFCTLASVDATLLWTVVGSGASVAGVGVAVAVWASQARSTRKHPPLTADQVVTVRLVPPRESSGGVGLAVLRPPTGGLPEHVRGRDELLARLRVLAASTDRRVHVLAGLGGTGKSTVALQVAEETAGLGVPVWWVPAVDGETVTARLMSLARELGASQVEVAEALAGQGNPADLLWRFLSDLPKWLLILDNADDPSVLTISGANAAGGAGWLRSSVTGLILVTSRDSKPQSWGRHAEVHTVKWLDEADGTQVLMDLAPDAGPLKDAAVLSQRLGGLPLALHHAGSQLAAPFAAIHTFAGYTQALDARFGYLMSMGEANSRAIVTRTWELSLDALAAQGKPQARPLLRGLSWLAPAVLIPPQLLDLTILARNCQCDEEEAADGLAALASVGLITLTPSSAGTRPAMTIHPLVSETSRSYLHDDDRTQSARIAVALVGATADRLREDSHDDWLVWVQIVPHLNALYSHGVGALADDDLTALANATAKAASAFVWAGYYTASQALAETALTQVTRLGADHPAVLSLRFQAAGALRSSGAYAAAEHEYRELLPTMERVLDPDHPDTVSTRFELSRTLAQQGYYQQAEHEYRELLPTMERVFGPDHLNTLAARQEIARMIAQQGHPRKAEHEYRELLTDRLRILGPNHPSTLTTRYEIARMIAGQGHCRKAEHEYRELLTDRLGILGPDHPSTLTTRYEIARMIAGRGRYRKARREFRNVLADELRILGPDHPHTLTTRHEIAQTLAARFHFGQALHEYRDVLARRIRVLGLDHPDTLITRHNIAWTLALQGDRQEAEREYREVLAKMTQVLGPDHPNISITQEALTALEAKTQRRRIRKPLDPP
jgi:tetratricopeptide (TPR) repeat protein